jgi:hypothetical protein
MNGRRKRTRIDGQFAAREIKMLESHAFRELSLSARRVLDRLEIELAHHGGMDNGKLPVTYDDFQRYGIDRHAAIAPAIRELVALGFVALGTGAGLSSITVASLLTTKDKLRGFAFALHPTGPFPERVVEMDLRASFGARQTPAPTENPEI